MDESPGSTWLAFLGELKTEILPLYAAHEQEFDYYSIHGRMHICRSLVFSEFMSRYYWANTRLEPRPTWIRYAVAFHDSGRRGNGPDVWEKNSAHRCTAYLASTQTEAAEEIGELIPKDGPGEWTLDKRIVHDADVLDIMRPCCGHGGRMGFREHGLRFLGRRDAPTARNLDVRDALIEEAWCLILRTEEMKPDLRCSTDYMRDVLGVLRNHSDSCPLLADCLLGRPEPPEGSFFDAHP